MGRSRSNQHSDSGLLRAKVSNYGATLVSLQVKGEGGYVESTLGYDTLKEWQEGESYFGCTVGRYGNRIKHGKFGIEGQGSYTLDHINNGENALHGGVKSYDKRVWDAEVVEGETKGVKMTLHSKDGDNGYPGALSITTWILLNNNDELLFKWTASVEGSKTVVNLTNHSYWNLGGWANGGGDVLDHKLELKADRYVAVDEHSIPTGELPTVRDTCFDFSEQKALKEGVEDALIAPQRGYDHTVVFTDGPSSEHPAPDAKSWAGTVPKRGTLFAPNTGIGFDLHTTEPGVQLYTGNYLSPEQVGYGGAKISHRGAVCLETQHFPDSPNRKDFPSTLLAPGERYEHTTVHRFFVKSA
eukprot:TRINITY_DN8907_c0_g1_i1.p1 TRINITY_DN8907_c0_g1~~TRINITY_DN8907_c0_g1_i1.p1  ORF type:complete len:356 (+),score=79.32 TRINITY_DN8907_c0_g1_i1:273-1340(+)